MRGRIAVGRLAARVLRPARFRGLGRVARLLFPQPAGGPARRVALACGTELWVPSDDSYWTAWSFRPDVYEPEIAHLLTGLAGPDAAFVDVGANVGLWTRRALVEGYAPTRMVAFEPASRLFELLERNVVLGEGVAPRLIHAAVGAEAGEGILVSSRAEGHAGASVRSTRPGAPADTSHDALGERVRVVSLAATLQRLREEGAAYVALKLDAEGAEKDILDSVGAADLLGLPCVVCFEEHRAKGDLDALRWVLEHDGFQVLAHSGPRWQRVSSRETGRALMTNPRRGYNFIAVPADVSGLPPEILSWLGSTGVA